MQVSEGIESIDGVDMYRIASVDELDPFLMTVVSNSDLWMFLSSTGGLTAGRVDAAGCCFPYETDDRLHHLRDRVGPATVLRVHRGDRCTRWEPFGDDLDASVERSLLKSTLGDAVVFEERHAELGLTIRARWAPSERFGWVRTVSLRNDDVDAEPVRVEILDGLLGVMPWGVDVLFQQRRSNLANAYRRSEIVHPDLGIYSLEARIVDLPEPAEALRATTVWSTGLHHARYSVDPQELAKMREGDAFGASHLRTGRPGSFLARADHTLGSDTEVRWHVVVDVAQSHTDLARLVATLGSSDDLVQLIDDDIDRCSSQLRRIVAGADGIQVTASTTNDAHHLANTLFNVMRGGVFADGYTIEAERFRSFVRSRNVDAAGRHAGWLDALPASIDVADLRAQAVQLGDPDLARLAHEYLPLSFSRRHGDPSRPWNQFRIRVRDADGDPVLSYEGNWRDIFQNWEALCRNSPWYLPSVIAKFLNASTADGFNPYRITSEGIDWEIPDPDDPWAGIGYWGDHQIVYLFRLLQSQLAHDPVWLRGELASRTYSFADVPYHIAPFERLVADPKHTIEFDAAADAVIEERVDRLGADGRLVVDDAGAVAHVTMIEKLLIPALAKLSNFVPRGGIWMNTERPEWNDANNALVGHGLSMVTLAHLRRYLQLLTDVTGDLDHDHEVSTDVIAWIEALTGVLEANASMLGAPAIDDRQRFEMLRSLTEAFDRYRSALATTGPSAPARLPATSLARLLRSAIAHLDDSLRSARRPDGLYDAYDLVEFASDGDDRIARVSRLWPMLEGQVAAISSGLLDVDEVVALVEAMYGSDLYRPDADSFLLYPARVRPSFLERNQIPSESVDDNPLLTTLLEAENDTVITRDVDGGAHFHADFANVADLETALGALEDTEFAALVAEHGAKTLGLFEEVFDHHRFTGRSSTMYAYEGIGSIYWHMVAKLLLAVQETILDAPPHASDASIDRLRLLYRRIRGGLGFNKTAAEYGAFPTDPYSHTPAHAGAQQPGMTGQVKEELLTRWAELGVTIEEGSVRVSPTLLDPREFGAEPARLEYVDAGGHDRVLEVPDGSLGFTLCRVPVVVQRAARSAMTITHADGSTRRLDHLHLDAPTSRQIFGHTGEVVRLDVDIQL